MSALMRGHSFKSVPNESKPTKKGRDHDGRVYGLAASSRYAVW